MEQGSPEGGVTHTTPNSPIEIPDTRIVNIALVSTVQPSPEGTATKDINVLPLKAESELIIKGILGLCNVMWIWRALLSPVRVSRRLAG